MGLLQFLELENYKYDEHLHGIKAVELPINSLSNLLQYVGRTILFELLNYPLQIYLKLIRND